MSLPVITALTPGNPTARLVSTLSTRAWGMALRLIPPMSIRGRAMSPAKAACPQASMGPSSLGILCPTTENSVSCMAPPNCIPSPSSQDLAVPEVGAFLQSDLSFQKSRTSGTVKESYRETVAHPMRVNLRPGGTQRQLSHQSVVLVVLIGRRQKVAALPA